MSRIYTARLWVGFFVGPGIDTSHVVGTAGHVIVVRDIRVTPSGNVGGYSPGGAIADASGAELFRWGGPDQPTNKTYGTELRQVLLPDRQLFLVSDDSTLNVWISGYDLIPT